MVAKGRVSVRLRLIYRERIERKKETTFVQKQNQIMKPSVFLVFFISIVLICLSRCLLPAVKIEKKKNIIFKIKVVYNVNVGFPIEMLQ